MTTLHNFFELITSKIIDFLTKHFRNTWVHRLALTNWIYKIIFHRVYGKEVREVTFRNIKLLIDTNDVTIAPTIITGSYEHFQLDLLGQILQPGDACIDIGANVGVYSLIASDLVGKRGRIISIEPVQNNLDILEKNIDLNNSNNITVINGAATNQSNKKTKIFIQPNSIGTHSAAVTSDIYQEVESVELDNLVHTLKLKKVRLIKIDVEGYEGFAIEGGQQTITKLRPIIMMEFDRKMLKSSGYSIDKMIKFLASKYRYVYIIDEKFNKLHKSDFNKIKNLLNSNIILSNEKVPEILALRKG